MGPEVKQLEELVGRAAGRLREHATERSRLEKQLKELRARIAAPSGDDRNAWARERAKVIAELREVVSELTEVADETRPTESAEG